MCERPVATAIPILAHYRIAPTDLVYLWEDCKRCFYDKYVHRLERPRSFSEHFTNADRAMRRALPAGKVIDLGVGQRFRVISQGGWVESKPIAFPSHAVSLSFRGQYDAVVVNDSDEFVVVDYKTTTMDDGALMKFRRQLMCYVTAIELPITFDEQMPAYVDATALLVFDPSNFVFNGKTKRSGLYGQTRWVELPRRNDLFDAFLQKVAAMLADPFAPRSDDKCGICLIRQGRIITNIRSVL